MNTWEHLDQFGDLDIKTSQRSKFRKSEKMVIVIKFLKKGHYIYNINLGKMTSFLLSPTMVPEDVNIEIF